MGRTMLPALLRHSTFGAITQKDLASSPELVDFGRHDEIVLREAADRVGAKLDAELLVSGQV